MAQIKELIQGTVGRIGELRVYGDNAVLNASVAVTPRKQVNGEWVDDVPIWTEVTIWGDVARNIAQSDVRPGTPVLIYGTRKARNAEAYQTKDGREVPARVEQSVTADIFAVEITRFSNVTKIEKAVRQDGGNHAKSKSNGNVQAAQPKKAQETEVNPADIFGAGLDNSVSLGSTEDIFGDDF